MKKVFFSLLMLLTALAAQAIVGANTGTESDNPIVITPSQVGLSTCGKLVIIRQVSGYSGTITDLEGESCKCYLTYNPILPAVLCWSYNVTGMVESYEAWESGHSVTDYRMRVTEIGLNYGYDDTAYIKCIKTLFKLTEDLLGEYFRLTGHFTTPLTAVYQNDYSLYVRDIYGDYGLLECYFDCTFTNGDIILDAEAQPLYYGKIPLISPVTSTFTPVDHQEPVLPDELPIKDLNQTMIHRYLCFNGVGLTDGTDGPRTISDGTGTLPLYNKFGIDITQDNDSTSGKNPHDLNGDGEVTISDVNKLIYRILHNPFATQATNIANTCDVTGFLTIRNSNLALIPIEIVLHRIPEDVNGDGEVNIADVNAIINHILNQ